MTLWRADAAVVVGVAEEGGNLVYLMKVNMHHYPCLSNHNGEETPVDGSARALGKSSVGR